MKKKIEKKDNEEKEEGKVGMLKTCHYQFILIFLVYFF